MTRYGDADDLPADLRDLSAGDRLARAVVAPNAEMWDDNAIARPIVSISMNQLADEEHGAVAVAPGHDLILRLSRHARGSAETQAERDWTLADVGDGVDVAAPDLDMIPQAAEPDDAAEYVTDWVKTIIPQRVDDPTAGRDELYIEDGNRLRLFDPFGPTRAYCRLRLTMADEAP